MTRRDALIALRDAVKERPYQTGADTKLCMAAFPDGAAERGSSAGTTCAAWNGSLDAAKALHEAVLPGWRATVHTWGKVEVRTEQRDDKDIHPLHSTFGASRNDPARAWLLAILSALISQEPDA